MTTDDESKDDPTYRSTDEEETPDAATAEEPDSDGDTDIRPVARKKPLGFAPGIPNGFAQSLLPSYKLNPLVEALGSLGKFKASSVALGFQAQQHSMLSRLMDPSRILGDLQRSIAPYTRAFAELPRLLLPPNLRDVSDHITARDVYEFLEKEGIPLYLIPRASIGKRLVLAKDHASRRKVLNDRFTHIVDDCAALLDMCTNPIVDTEVHFIQDGIGALRAGHHASAQAIFTVTLDTLISRFYPDRQKRKEITNRKKGAQMPDAISDMGIREAYVWLPVWNAHQEFWQHKGDRIPNDYSRHATVHGVSKTQFNKRNCVQSLMLASSLIGYANQLA